jgi:hypothetical protein
MKADGFSEFARCFIEFEVRREKKFSFCANASPLQRLKNLSESASALPSSTFVDFVTEMRECTSRLEMLAKGGIIRAEAGGSYTDSEIDIDDRLADAVDMQQETAIGTIHQTSDEERNVESSLLDSNAHFLAISGFIGGFAFSAYLDANLTAVAVSQDNAVVAFYSLLLSCALFELVVVIACLWQYVLVQNSSPVSLIKSRYAGFERLDPYNRSGLWRHFRLFLVFMTALGAICMVASLIVYSFLLPVTSVRLRWVSIAIICLACALLVFGFFLAPTALYIPSLLQIPSVSNRHRARVAKMKVRVATPPAASHHQGRSRRPTAVGIGIPARRGTLSNASSAHSSDSGP